MSNPSFLIHPAPAVAEAGVVDALRGIVVSHLSDNLQRLSGVTGLQRIHRSTKLVGTAFTLKTRPGDNLAIHRAFDFCRPGDVLVIDGAGDLTQALMGEIMASFAESLGVQGLVIDGAIRDVGTLRQRDFPVYARGVTHRGPYKNGPGEINVPVTVGGMVVHPGDIIVGDEDGLLAISPADVKAVIEGARRQHAKETAALNSIANGSRTSTSASATSNVKAAASSL